MIITFIQARMSSTRFPGKVLKHILGKPILQLQIERARACKTVDKVVVLTSISEDDRPIVDMCKKINVDFFCGSLENVLDRFYQAAVKFKPDHIIRLTGDCPLIDAKVIDDMVKLYLKEEGDYGTNCVPVTYPDGLDAEILTFKALQVAHTEAVLPSHLEHLSLFFEEQSERFKIVNLANNTDLSSLRWTVDESEDFEFVKAIFEELYPKKPLFCMQDVLDLLKRRPELILLNNRFNRNEGLFKSKEQDNVFLEGKTSTNMSNTVSILFRVDVYEKLGLGHLSRCRSLMAAFLHYSECQFAVLSNNETVVREFIPNIAFDFYHNRNELKNTNFDILIVDVPDIASGEDEDFRGVAKLVVCIEDAGRGLSYQNILIRPNLLNLPISPNLKIAKNNYWSGRDYIILHNDFAKQVVRNDVPKEKAEELLLCFGGSDPCGLTLRAIPLFKELEGNISFHVVIGPAFSWKDEVSSIINDDARFHLSINCQNMAEHFSKADIALISGGTMLYEACAMGTPALVFSQNQEQEIEAKICQAAGAVASLGVSKSVSDDKIFSAVKKIIRDTDLRLNMAKAGPKIVSSDGAAHIVSSLLKYIKKESIK
ncbi:MAG: hypothetical protein GY853_11500 [PVC group bacterium]|nr:hypothetical protein [PVC group bacterium]